MCVCVLGGGGGGGGGWGISSESGYVNVVKFIGGELCPCCKKHQGGLCPHCKKKHGGIMSAYTKISCF